MEISVESRGWSIVSLEHHLILFTRISWCQQKLVLYWRRQGQMTEWAWFPCFHSIKFNSLTIPILLLKPAKQARMVQQFCSTHHWKLTECYGRQNNGPQRQPHTNPKPAHVLLPGKADLPSQMELRMPINVLSNTLSWIIQVPQHNLKVTEKWKVEAEEAVREMPGEGNWICHCWLWRPSKETTSQGTQVSSRGWERQGCKRSPKGSMLFS